jgi:hypothetical protein
MKYFYYDKITDEVKMISDGEIEVNTDIFNVLSVELTEEQENKLNEGYKPFIINNELVLNKIN